MFNVVGHICYCYEENYIISLTFSIKSIIKISGIDTVNSDKGKISQIFPLFHLRCRYGTIDPGHIISDFFREVMRDAMGINDRHGLGCC